MNTSKQSLLEFEPKLNLTQKAALRGSHARQFRTANEITEVAAIKTGLNRESMRKRIKELVRMGKLIEGTPRRCRTSGITAMTYRKARNGG